MKTTSASRSILLPAVFWLTMLAVLGLAGCTAVDNAGATAVAYVRGELSANVTSDYNKTVEAARAAIKDSEFVKVSENKDAFSALLVARTAQDKKVEIELTNTGKKLTNIKIRVGLIGGDQPLSMAILDKIKAGL